MISLFRMVSGPSFRGWEVMSKFRSKASSSRLSFLGIVVIGSGSCSLVVVTLLPLSFSFVSGMTFASEMTSSALVNTSGDRWRGLSVTMTRLGVPTKRREVFFR